MAGTFEAPVKATDPDQVQRDIEVWLREMEQEDPSLISHAKETQDAEKTEQENASPEADAAQKSEVKKHKKHHHHHHSDKHGKPAEEKKKEAKETAKDIAKKSEEPKTEEVPTDQTLSQEEMNFRKAQAKDIALEARFTVLERQRKARMTPSQLKREEETRARRSSLKEKQEKENQLQEEQRKKDRQTASEEKRKFQEISGQYMELREEIQAEAKNASLHSDLARINELDGRMKKKKGDRELEESKAERLFADNAELEAAAKMTAKDEATVAGDMDVLMERFRKAAEYAELLIAVRDGNLSVYQLVKKTRELEAGAPRPLTAAENTAQNREEKRGKVEGVRGWIEKVIGEYIGSLGGLLSDSFSFFGGMDGLEDAQKYQAKASDFINKAKGEMKEQSGGNISGFISAAAALVSFIMSIGQLWISVQRYNDLKGTLDEQEKKAKKRGITEAVFDLLNGALSASAPFTGLVPFLGESLGLLQNGIEVVRKGMMLSEHSERKSSIEAQKSELWERMQQKKKLYGSEGNSTALGAISIKSGNAKKQNQAVSSVYATADAGSMVTPQMLEDAIATERERWHGLPQEQREDTAQLSAHKKKMRELKARQMMQDFQIANEGYERMNKKTWHDKEDIALGAVGMVGNGATLLGQILAATGVGAAAGGGLIGAGGAIKAGSGMYSFVRKIGSDVHARKNSKHNIEKRKRRSNIANMLYNKMNAVGIHHPWLEAFWSKGAAIPQTIRDDQFKDAYRQMDFIAQYR
jgi:hypothetical protein